jgi:hypothetical protein
MEMNVANLGLAGWLALSIAAPAFAQTNAPGHEASEGQMADIAKKLNNPVANLIYADKPAGGPNWGLRFAVTLGLPK